MSSRSVKHELSPGENAPGPGNVERTEMARILRSLAPALLPALLALGAALPAAAAGKLAEVTVDVPREHRIPLSIAFEKATVFAVESHNEPKTEDVEEAKAKDPEDRTWVALRFYLRNDGYTKQKVNVQALLLDAEGGVLAQAKDRTTSVARLKAEDTLTLPMRVKTLDWPRAAKLKVQVTFFEP